jgi:DNA-binding LacI/PurR family transcriptional regulator
MGDVASHVGVSRALVSMVFRGVAGPSEETRGRILRAAEQLGYHPDPSARLLRRRRSGQLGVIFSMRQPFEVELAEALYVVAAKHGYDLTLGPLLPGRAQGMVVQELLSRRCEAVILLESDGEKAPIVALAAQVPVVQVACSTGNADLDVVRSDDAKGVSQGVDHLVQLGHARITHIDGGRHPGAADRRRGYRTGMRRHGLAAHIDVIPGDYTEHSGAHAARELLVRSDPPTAVITGNDRCALGLLDAMVRHGLRVPEDMSVIGYDDSSVARLPFINLTTVRQDAPRLAELAIESVLERLDGGRREVSRIALTPELVIRGTTRRLDGLRGPCPRGQPRREIVEKNRRAV